MKVRQAGSNVIASEGVKSEGKFQILANAQAFRILSSGLYSDKIAAVLREIGCNAADSHIAAGCPDRPIEVKLPTALDRDFYIKDFGTGLTHEEITGLFTTYFSSNKSESNDLTGAFGLGSKSPFSYTDSFAVTVVKNGVQRAYTAHIGADGSPVISLLAESPATAQWPSGMMVTFPVKPSDVSEFHTKAQKVFRHFKVKPDLLGGDPVQDIERGVEGETFYFPAAKQGRDEQAMVLAGNVAYPLRLERLELPADAIGQRALVSEGIYLLMPIGSVMPTASREELEYDPLTRENVLKALTAAGSELAQRVYEKATEPCPTEWERHVRIQAFRKELPASFPAIRPLLNLLQVPALERDYLEGLFADTTVELADWVGSAPEDKDVQPSAVAGLNRITPLNKAQAFDVWLVREVSRPNGNRVEKRRVVGGKFWRGSDLKDPIELPYSRRVGVFFDDSTHSYARLRQHVEEKNLDIALLVVPAYKDAQTQVKSYAERISTSLGGIAVTGTSALGIPLTVQASRGKETARQAALARVYATQEVIFVPFKKDSTFSRDNRIKVADVPETARYYATGYQLAGALTRFYVKLPTDAKRGIDHGPMMAIARDYRIMRARGIPLPPIEGVAVLEPGQLVKLKLRENGWKPLFESIIEALTAKPAVQEFKKRLTRMPVLDWDRYNAHYAVGVIGHLAQAQREKSAFWKYAAQRLEQFPVLFDLLTEFVRTNDPKEPAGIRIFLKSLLSNLPFGGIKGLPVEMACRELQSLTEEAYPLLRYLDENYFAHKKNDNPAVAFACLKQLLIPKDNVAELLESEVPQLQAAAA